MYMDLNRIAPYCGLLSSAAFIILWVAAAMLDPDWSLGKLSLSDLGNCGIDSAEICFNMACASSGAFGIAFSLGMIDRGGIFRICGFFSLCCCFLVISIGIIDLGYGQPHLTVAFLYSISATLCMVTSSYGDWKDGKRKISIFTVIMLLLCALMVVTQPFEVFEPFAICCILTWTTTQSLKMLKYQ